MWTVWWGAGGIKKYQSFNPKGDFSMSFNIAMVSSATCGGSGITTSVFADILAQRGNNVYHLAFDRPYFIGDTVQYCSVSPISYPLFGNNQILTEALAEALVNLVEEKSIDYVYGSYLFVYGGAVVLAKQILRQRGNTKTKFILKAAGTDVHTLGLRYKKMVRYWLESADLVVVTNPAFIALLNSEYDFWGNICEIPNCVDIERFSRKQDECVANLMKHYGKDVERILVHSSNFREVKRPLDVLSAYQMLNDEIPSSLVLVGDGPLLPEVLKKASVLGILDHVYSAGQVVNVPQYLSVADLKLQLSTNEGLSLSVLEAQACGVPAVVSNIGGLPYCIEDGKTGYVVDVSDPQMAAERAYSILYDTKTLNNFRENSRVRATERFDRNKVVTQFEQTLTSM